MVSGQTPTLQGQKDNQFGGLDLTSFQLEGVHGLTGTKGLLNMLAPIDPWAGNIVAAAKADLTCLSSIRIPSFPFFFFLFFFSFLFNYTCGSPPYAGHAGGGGGGSLI